MQRVRRSLLVAVTLFAAASRLEALPPQPRIFSGVDLFKYFSRVALPEYPYDARRMGWSGRGTFRAHVEPSGKVTRVEVIRSTGYKALDEAVVIAGRRWRARPGRKLEIDFPIAFLPPDGGRPPPW